MAAVLEEHVFSIWERVPKRVKKIQVWKIDWHNELDVRDWSVNKV